MQAKFCTSVLQGLPIPPVMLWERPEGTWVLDGQQRLTALGVRLVRPHAGGRANAQPSAYFNSTKGVFAAEQRHWSLTALRLARWHALDVSRKRPSRNIREWEWNFAANEIMRKRTLVTYVLGPKATLDDAVQAFRSINTPGIPMSLAEVEALIATASN